MIDRIQAGASSGQTNVSLMGTKILAAAFAIVALASACAAPVGEEAAQEANPCLVDGRLTLTVEASAGLSESQLRSITASWERFSGRPGSLALSAGDGGTCSIVGYSATHPTVLALEAKENAHLGGYAPPTGGIILVPERLGSCLGREGSCSDLIALHEIGHAFGMAHHGGHGLMASESAPFFTRDDRAECVRVGACEPTSDWTPVGE